MFTIANRSAKVGKCSLCNGKNADKEQQVFPVTSSGFTGQVCGSHLFVLNQQAPPEPAVAEDREPLFNGSR